MMANQDLEFNADNKIIEESYTKLHENINMSDTFTLEAV